MPNNASKAHAPAPVYVAQLETANFSFQAVGMSRLEAADALEQGLRAHAKLYRVSQFWTRTDFDLTEMKPGACYRDREEI